MAMAPKAEMPLFHQSRLGGRPAASRRRRASGTQREQKKRGTSCYSVLLVGLGVVVVFGLGTFVGIELAQTDLHKGNFAPLGGHMPPLQQPTNEGWGKWSNNAHIEAIPTQQQQEQRGHPLGYDPRSHKIHQPEALLREQAGHAGIRGASRGGDRGGGHSMGGVGLVAVPWLQKHSFHAREGAYVTLKEKSLDISQEVTATAWILVDRDTSDIKTVLGNKMSGCGSDALGFALYINEWNKKDGQLWLEWGDGAMGCHKIFSTERVPVDSWVHVAARFDSGGDGRVSLFLDGVLVASGEGSRRPGSREDFAIGAFSNGDFPFEGRIGSVVVYGTALTDTQIADVVKMSKSELVSHVVEQSSLAEDYPNLLVALQLDEAFSPESEKDGAEARHGNGAGGLDGGTYHFMHMQEPPKVDENLKDGISTTEVTPSMREKSDQVGRERARKVKEAMQHTWKGYEQYAWGGDELAPRSKKAKSSWGDMGVTLVDSLDTLWLMGMKEEFWRARDWVRDHLSFNNAGDVSVFETTIRELGGLLSAYDLSGDDIFKTKAKELADKLLPAFNTNSGIPTPRVNFKTGRNSGGSKSVLAEIGTLQVEFRYLSKITGISMYADKVNRVFDIMHENGSDDGLYPIFINPISGKSVGSQVTFGALGDSFYEYLLKVWLQGGKTETKYRKMYDRAMDGMTRTLLKKSDPSGLTYVSDWNGRNNVHKMDHLVCFLAGTLALGSQTAENPATAERDLKTAKALAYTCYQMYQRQKTGLAPEMVIFEKGKDMVVSPKTAYNILRPETAEALYVLHQITGDPIYREWSWDIFQAFEKYCRLPVGFGSFPNVNDVRAQPEDRMESFFLAETLKYLYLIQDPDQQVDLTKFVFNTEAHPLRMFDDMERQEGRQLTRNKLRHGSDMWAAR